MGGEGEEATTLWGRVGFVGVDWLCVDWRVGRGIRGVRCGVRRREEDEARKKRKRKEQWSSSVLPAVTALDIARKWEEILDVVSTRRAELRTSHFSVALLRLAKLAARGKTPQGRMNGDNDRLQTLIQDSFRQVEDPTPPMTRHLSNSLWACGILRISPGDERLTERIVSTINDRISELRPEDITNVHWSCERLGLVPLLDSSPVEAYMASLPFRIYPGVLSAEKTLTVDQLLDEVDLAREIIALKEKRVVESRWTAWQHRSGLSFYYSGKEMTARPFSPTVDRVREVLLERTGVDYDGCLVNYYEHGKAGMRYHSDPDQGVLWTTDTAVVSVGDTRQFCLRRTDDFDARHVFYVTGGDVVVMRDHCQRDYQHCIRVENEADDAGPRFSLVYKKSLAR